MVRLVEGPVSKAMFAPENADGVPLAGSAAVVAYGRALF